MDDLWRTIPCTCISGIDPLAGGSVTGTAPVECSSCNGSGRIWIRPSGHLFLYPGGPAAGMASHSEYLGGTPDADEKEGE